MRSGFGTGGLAALCALAAASLAGAQDTAVAGVRIGATDVPALAEFYAAAFDLKEVNRINAPGLEEILMNFGATAEEARASTAPQVVIMGRAADAPADAMPHLLFRVDDMAASIARVTEAGGAVEREPAAIGDVSFAFIRDPQGNVVELLDFP